MIWNIIKENLESSGTLDGLDERQRLVAIDTIENRFTGMSKDELIAIGIKSGNAHVIDVGEKIDMSALYESKVDQPLQYGNVPHAD